MRQRRRLAFRAATISPFSTASAAIIGHRISEVYRVKKILWVKFGWSKYYRGEPVDGNFGWLNEKNDDQVKKMGYEAYNFMPASDGGYYIFLPPQSGTSSPSNPDPYGWTVVCLAKNPQHPGIHIVGWFENATLIGKWLPPPDDRKTNPSGDVRPGYDWSYCIKSDTAYFIPPEFRNSPFSDPSIRQGKYSFLTGPNLKIRNAAAEASKARVLAILEAKMKELAAVAVQNPNASNPPDFDLVETDPLGGFGGTPEQRKKIEEAAERAVIAHYEALGYQHRDMTKVICGYDFCFSKGRQELHVEVKGTSGGIEHFYLTRNEYNNGLMVNEKWRLAMVTHALAAKPTVKVYKPKELKLAFDIEPLCFEAKLIPQLTD
jgi:hypothetical protein